MDIPVLPEPVMGLPSPEPTDRRPAQSPLTAEDGPSQWPSPQHNSTLSSWDNPRESEFDSIANFATSSEGTPERDNVSMTDFAHGLPKEVHAKSIPWGDSLGTENPILALASNSPDFKGFKGHDSNPLFVDHSDSDYGSVKEEEKISAETEELQLRSQPQTSTAYTLPRSK